MRRIVLVLWLVFMAAVMVASAFPAFAEPPSDPSQKVLDNGASNLGVCSSFLGGLQVRDDVNHLVKAQGYDDPGELYKVRAQEHPGKEGYPNRPTPKEECRPR